MVLNRRARALKANSLKEHSAKDRRMKQTRKSIKRSAKKISKTNMTRTAADRSDIDHSTCTDEAVGRIDPEIESYLQYNRSRTGVEMILCINPSNTVPVVQSETSAVTTLASSSLHAYEEGLWHQKMNKHGIYRPHGIVMTGDDGSTWWQEELNEPWLRAVYHDDIRAELIDECALQGKYQYARAGGKQGMDITSFHPDQKHWGFQRHQRPDILHQFEKADHINPDYPVHIWVYHGAVVLGYDDCPVLNFANLPATISSMVEGGLQEAIIREDSRIDAKDFHVRMPTDPKGKGKMSLPGLSAISMRRSRFRWRAGYLSWTPRTGSDDIKRYLCGLLPQKCKAENSTKGFRELKSSEVKLMAAMNRGKHLKRAGSRALPAAKRRHSDALFYKSISNAMKSENKTNKYSDNSEEDADFDIDEDYDMHEAGLPDEVSSDDNDREKELEEALSQYSFASMSRNQPFSWPGRMY